MNKPRRCAGGSPTFTTSTNYINKKGKNPSIMEAINWEDLVFKKEELNEENWLYVGDATQEEKESQLQYMKFCNGWVWITS